MFSVRQGLKNISNIPGKSFSDRFVIIESDDWGTIRMPSLAIFRNLEKQGLDLRSNDCERYCRNDTLASAEDLTGLFEVLSYFKDSIGSHPVFTALSLTANPNFEAIENDRFEKYHYELFTSTLERYGRIDAFSLWKEGIAERLFIPQFHGREHLNVPAWLRALRRGDRQIRLAFDYQMWAFNNPHPYGISYPAAFDLDKPQDISSQEKIISDGLKLFEQLHGYTATFFVPPNGPFNNNLEKVAAKEGIKYMSGPKVQREPIGYGKTRVKFHYLGQKNLHSQYYITRNCVFEPSIPGVDWVDSCLMDIKIAFSWKKPAVISTHRVNYIGGLNQENRSKGLKLLRKLLTAILKYWPDVKFLTSHELGKQLSQPKHA